MVGELGGEGEGEEEKTYHFLGQQVLSRKGDMEKEKEACKVSRGVVGHDGVVVVVVLRDQSASKKDSSFCS